MVRAAESTSEIVGGRDGLGWPGSGQADRAELAQHGTIIKDKATGVTQPQPQTDDGCHELVVYYYGSYQCGDQICQCVGSYTYIVCP